MDQLLLLRQENAKYLLVSKHRRYLDTVLLSGLRIVEKHESSAEAVRTVSTAQSSCSSHHDPEGYLHGAVPVSADVETYLLSGIYWTLAGLCLLQGDEHDRPPAGLTGIRLRFGQKHQLLQIVKSCKRMQLCEQRVMDSKGISPCVRWTGFAPHPAAFYDATALSTLSALQIIVLLEGCNSAILSEDSITQLRRFVRLLQDPVTGGFANRVSVGSAGEVDVRFAMCGVASLVLLEECSRPASGDRQRGLRPDAAATQASSSESAPLRSLDSLQEVTTAKPEAGPVSAASISSAVSPYIDAEKLFAWLTSCQNPDGGFGCFPGCESHAGTTFCAVASLKLAGLLGRISPGRRSALERWLGERQVRDGGMNGRPGKDPDSCYTWWVLATSTILGMKIHSVFDTVALEKFVLSCQDENGGFSRAPRRTEPGLTPSTKPLFRRPELATVASEHGQEIQDCGLQTAGCLALLGKGRLEEHTESRQVPDPFHTFFGLAGLSVLLGAEEFQGRRRGLEDIRFVRKLLKLINPILGVPDEFLQTTEF